MPSSVDLRIRPATPEDAAFVIGLAPRFAETRPQWRSAEEVARGVSRALETALNAARDEEAIFVAEASGGTRAGFVYVVAGTDFFTSEPVAHISDIAVVRDGTGAGAALMRAAEAWALERNARYVSLHVHAPNERAQAFYKSQGYDLEWHRLNKRLR